MSYPLEKEYCIVQGFLSLAYKRHGEDRTLVFDTVRNWLKEIDWSKDDIDYWVSKFDNYEIGRVPTRFSASLEFGITDNFYELTLEETASPDLHKDIEKLGLIPENYAPRQYYPIRYSKLYNDKEIFDSLVSVLHKHFPANRVKLKNRLEDIK